MSLFLDILQAQLCAFENISFSNSKHFLVVTVRRVMRMSLIQKHFEMLREKYFSLLFCSVTNTEEKNLAINQRLSRRILLLDIHCLVSYRRAQEATGQKQLRILRQSAPASGAGRFDNIRSPHHTQLVSFPLVSRSQNFRYDISTQKISWQS